MPESSVVLPPAKQLIEEAEALAETPQSAVFISAKPSSPQRILFQPLTSVRHKAAPYPKRSSLIVLPSVEDALGGPIQRPNSTTHFGGMRKQGHHRSSSSTSSKAVSPTTLLSHLHLQAPSSPTAARPNNNPKPFTPIATPTPSKPISQALYEGPTSREYESTDPTQLSYRRCSGKTCFYIPPPSVPGADLMSKLASANSTSAFTNDPVLSSILAGSPITPKGWRTISFCPLVGKQSGAYESRPHVGPAGVFLSSIETTPNIIFGSRQDVADLLQTRVSGMGGEIASTTREIRIIVTLDGKTSVTRSVPLRCSCGGITRARLAYEVVQASRLYFNISMSMSGYAPSNQAQNQLAKTLARFRLVKLESENGVDWLAKIVTS